MRFRVLGQTGVEVSGLCLGTMTFGAEADEKASEALYHAAREAGINFFDTANVYAHGRSEEILGRLIAPERDAVVVATKAHFPTSDHRNSGGLSRRHLISAVEASLRRLGTDRIDLYFAHGFDNKTPILETLRVFDDLVRQGKVLYLGVSNWAAWQLAIALGLSERERLERFQCVQPMYNLVKRQAEVEILPLAAATGLGVMSYSPLGGGLLSGKYSTKDRPAQARLITNEMYKRRYGAEHYYQVAERFKQYATEAGLDPATLAVAWVTSHPAITSAIIGARTVEQLAASLKASELRLEPKELAALSALGPAPPPATDRLEEQAGFVYPGARP